MRVLVLLFLVGCAHRVVVTSEGDQRRFCLANECYQLGHLGPSWQVVQREDGEIGFYSAEVGGVIKSSAVCREDVEAVPLQSLTERMLVGYTERIVRSVDTVPFVEREALRTVVDAKLDGVHLVLELLVFKRNGCLFDLDFAAAPAGYERGAVDFHRFVAGFAPAARHL